MPIMISLCLAISHAVLLWRSLGIRAALELVVFEPVGFKPAVPKRTAFMMRPELLAPTIGVVPYLQAK